MSLPEPITRKEQYLKAIAEGSGGGGGGSDKRIKKGTSTPSSSQGANGDIYLQYSEYRYTSFMDGNIIVRENLKDNTDIKLFIVGLSKNTSFLAITDTDLATYLSDITSGYLKACASYDSEGADTQTGILAIGNWGSGLGIHTYVPGWTQYKAGTFYGMLDLNEPPVQAVGMPTVQQNGNPICDSDNQNPIIDAYAKVNGAWQNLIGTNVNDIL